MKKFKLLIPVCIILALVFSTAISSASIGSESNTDEALLEDGLLLETDIIKDNLPMPNISTYAAYSLSCSANFKRKGNTKATSEVLGSAQGLPDTLNSVITLQVYSAKKKAYVNSGAASASQTVSKKSTIRHYASFKISSDKKYRVQILLMAKYPKGIVRKAKYYRTLS